jgi:fructose 1,6-bisphosphate aldolase/phosphatase
MKVTLSVIKADIGRFVGHSSAHPEILAKAEQCLRTAKRNGVLILPYDQLRR